MRILVFGANGFVGSSIASDLEKRHEVWRGIRGVSDESRTLSVDLLDLAAVSRAIALSLPDVIINAAGVVDNTEASELNLTFTQNILGAIALSGLAVTPKLIICGSAAEYGYVDPANIPVSEECPTEPFSIYGNNKLKETEYALSFGSDNNIDVVIARIFNPIGAGMADKFLIPRLLDQIYELEDDSGMVEISRKDSIRDYIDVRDLAVVIGMLSEGKTKHHVYNIGSGIGTTNYQLVEAILQQVAPEKDIKIVETSSEPERPVASQADISRLKDELGWEPRYTIIDTIKELINAKT